MTGAILWAWSAIALCGADAPKLNVDWEIGWQGCWRPTEWLPVEVRIQSAEKKPFEGVISLTGQQDTLTECSIEHRFVLTPDVPITVPLVAKIEFGAPTLRLEIRSARGRTEFHEERALFDFSSRTQRLEAIAEQDLLVVTSGRDGFDIAKLGEGATSSMQALFNTPAHRLRPQLPNEGRVHVAEKSERGLPWDWTAYASADLLVLYDVSWTSLREEQIQAIADHVSSGGTLLVVLGGNVLPAESALAKLLPCAIGEARECALPAQFVDECGITGVAGPKVPLWTLALRDDSGAQPMTFAPAGTGDTVTYYASAGWGLGRVGVLAFDPARIGGVKARGDARFWIHVMRPLLYAPTIVASSQGTASEGNQHMFQLGLRSQGDTSLLAYLHAIPELRPIGVGWVILLLVGLAIVIGPVDYLLLKRFDRLPLTWLTLPAYLIAFSAFAFWGIQALRAGDAQARAVTVLDMVEGRPEAWSATTMGIYAPYSDDWRPVDARRPQWWSSLSPRESGSLYVYGGGGIIARRFACKQEDGRTVPTYLPVNIWCMQSMLLEERVQAAPPIVVDDLSIDGTRCTLTVRNVGDRPIAWATLRVRDSPGNTDVGCRLGAFAPGEQRAIQTVLHGVGNDAELEGTTQGRIAGIPSDNFSPVGNDAELEGTTRDQGGRDAYGPGVSAFGAFTCSGSLARTHAFDRLLKEGWALVSLRIEDPPLPFTLEDKEYATRHVQFVRLAVRPE